MQGKLAIKLVCEIHSKGVESKGNRFTLAANQIAEMHISDRLFGPASAVFVTRTQMTQFSSEVYTTMNVLEEYQLPQYAFDQSIIDVVVRQATSQGFSYTPIAQALQELSKYQMQFAQDLTPDRITKDLGQIFQVVKKNNKSHIVLNSEFLK